VTGLSVSPDEEPNGILKAVKSTAERSHAPLRAFRGARYLRAIGVGGIVALIVLIVASDLLVSSTACRAPCLSRHIRGHIISLAGWLV